MSKAQQLFDAAFDRRGRAPRSLEYRAGALYILQLRAEECETTPCPYPAGTAQFDAYYAGTLEGHSLWRDAQTGGAA